MTINNETHSEFENDDKACIAFPSKRDGSAPSPSKKGGPGPSPLCKKGSVLPTLNLPKGSVGALGGRRLTRRDLVNRRRRQTTRRNAFTPHPQVADAVNFVAPPTRSSTIIVILTQTSAPISMLEGIYLFPPSQKLAVLDQFWTTYNLGILSYNTYTMDGETRGIKLLLTY